ncbi:MAG TPA: TonB-dependent receptor [Steroidobacteraceae bacterium]|nr:TonB-dependent receptor [Steroidobacteraceae bacterium]
MSLRSVAAALGAGALLWNAASLAERATDASTADAGSLGEVVVTAQRREESAQSVGIALSVVSGQALADKAITNVVDLQNAIPSLQVEPAFGGGQPQYRIRGVGFLDYTSNNASPIGVSIDDVAFALPIQTAGQLFDVDRIEVLRGPQGTLYGRNTTGGQINFITNRPTADTHAGFTAEYGSHNEVNAEGYVSGSITDGLLGRLSVATEQGGEWQRNRDTGQRLGNKDKIAGRGQLEWKPSEAVDFRLEFHLAKDKSDEAGLYLLKPYTRTNASGAITTTIPADTSRYVTDWNLNPAFASITGLNAGSKPGVDNANNGVDLTANLNLGGAKLTSITAYNKMIRREYGDWDATQYHDSDEYFRSDLDVFSEELRIASTGTDKLGWVGGIFYSDQNLAEKFYSDFSDSQLVGGGIALTTYEQKANSFGEFAQVNYEFSSELKATLGVREDHETRELVNLNTGFLVPSIPSFTGGAQNRSLTSNLPSGKVELDYTPVAGTLVYESISRGVKSGGFTAHNTVTAPAADPFEPEKLTAYEVGVKSDVTQTLRVNASAFYYRYRDEQILGKVFDTTSNSFIGRFVNVPHSRLSGGELEVEWHPLAGLSISQYAGFVEGYYTSPLFDTSNVPYDGRPLSVPKWTYGGDVSYGFDVGGFKVTAESNYSFHDTYSQFYLLGSNDYTIPKYWLTNANLSLSPASGAPWRVTLWGRNIFDKAYDVTRNFFLPTAEVAQAGEPATFGIRVSYKY